MATKRPNIILIMTDQHRYDRLGCMGDPLIQTPHLDGLAHEGVVFDSAYTASPVCGPARAALKSGMYPPGCGVVNNWVGFRENTELLTHRLQAAGYQTALCGKLHFCPAEASHGFEWRQLHDAPYSVYANDDCHSEYIRWLRDNAYRDSAVDPVTLFDEDENAFKTNDWFRFIMGSSFRREQDHDTVWTMAQAMRFLDERDVGRPFFLFLSYFGPHQPFAAPSPWGEMYDPDNIALPPQFAAAMDDNPVFAVTCDPQAKQFRQLFDLAAYRRILAAYYGQVSMIDHYLGQFITRLKADGLWDDSLVIFCSDHGDHNGAYGLFFKGQMYDSCCRIPLIVKPPCCACPGERRQQIVNLLDLYGTILDAAGDESWQQPEIEARSLSPLLWGKRAEWANETWAIIGERPETNLTMLRRDHMKLIRLARGAENALYELYDLRDAIPEVRDVYRDPAYAAERAVMKSDLDAWQRAQADKYPRRIVSYRIGTDSLGGASAAADKRR